MQEYHKINTVYKRDMSNKGKLIIGDYSQPEFEYLKDNEWIWDEKIDGTNVRVIWNNNKLSFGGKTDNAEIPVPLFNRLKELFIDELFKNVFDDKKVCLYGEGYGRKIQNGGKYISNGVDFILFDVKIGEWWLKREDVEIIANELKIKVVPIIGSGTLDEMVELCKKGFKSQWGDFVAEGIVARPKVELKDRSGKRIITKIKYKDFKE